MWLSARPHRRCVSSLVGGHLWLRYDGDGDWLCALSGQPWCWVVSTGYPANNPRCLALHTLVAGKLWLPECPTCAAADVPFPEAGCFIWGCWFLLVAVHFGGGSGDGVATAPLMWTALWDALALAQSLPETVARQPLLWVPLPHRAAFNDVCVQCHGVVTGALILCSCCSQQAAAGL